MWVFIYSYAEIVACSSFGVGDHVEVSCRNRPDFDDLELPPGINRSVVLLEDADYGIGPSDDDSFVEVVGRVREILVARDERERRDDGAAVRTLGTRRWRSVDHSRRGRSAEGPSAYLVLVEAD